MKYRVTHTTRYSYSESVPLCHNLVHLWPRTLRRQTCQNFQLHIHPDPIDLHHRLDYFGNHATYFSVDHAHLGLTITGTSDVAVESENSIVETATAPWEQIATRLRRDRSPEMLDAFQFVTPSPYIVPFDGLKTYAMSSFPKGRPIWDAVLDLTSRIHQDFRYDPQVTTIQTPLREIFEQRHGVCQDFAHLQIACLRSLGLAARYVSGYLRTVPLDGRDRLVGADASHAWASVFCGDAGWTDFDPTNDLAVGTDHVTVAWGRDYGDVCPIKGVIVGGGDHRMSVSVDVSRA